MGYLVIVLEKPSTTRAERSLALEKEQAIVIQNFRFFQRQKEIKNLRRRREIFFLFFGEKRNFLSKERNLPQQRKTLFLFGNWLWELALSNFV